MPTLRDELWNAFVAGFEASGDGYHGAYRLGPDADTPVANLAYLKAQFDAFLQREGL